MNPSITYDELVASTAALLLGHREGFAKIPLALIRIPDGILRSAQFFGGKPSSHYFNQTFDCQHISSAALNIFQDFTNGMFPKTAAINERDRALVWRDAFCGEMLAMSVSEYLYFWEHVQSHPNFHSPASHRDAITPVGVVSARAASWTAALGMNFLGEHHMERAMQNERMSDERRAEIRSLREAMCLGTYNLHDVNYAIDDLLHEVERARRVEELGVLYAGEMNGRVAALEAVVARLPRTADGVPILLGGAVWAGQPYFGMSEEACEWTVVSLATGTAIIMRQGRSRAAAFSDCYSTREAAEAAKKGES